MFTCGQSQEKLMEPSLLAPIQTIATSDGRLSMERGMKGGTAGFKTQVGFLLLESAQSVDQAQCTKEGGAGEESTIFHLQD